MRISISMAGEEEKVSTPYKSVMKTHGYIGTKKWHQQIPIIHMGRTA